MAENPSDALPAPPRKRKKGGGAKFLFVVLIILALLGVIVYLVSLINSKKFFLVPEGDQLVVKKGVFFLAGSENYQGENPEEADLYAPIELPPKFGVGQKEFPDLASLNQEFASLLIEQSQHLVFSSEEASYQKGRSYLVRLGSLQGLGASQLQLIQGLNADVDYIDAKRAYIQVEKTLERALKKFKQAETFGTGRFPDASDWIRKVNLLLDSIRSAKAGVGSVVPAPGTMPGLPPEIDDQPEGLQEPLLGTEPQVAPPGSTAVPQPKGGI